MLEITDWSLDEAALEVVLAEVTAGRETIVECGSGVSTILIGRLLRDRGHGRLYALEHDPSWARLVSSRIAGEGLEAQVRLIEAPLRPDPLAPPRCRWYSREALAELPAVGIDLLLVDGAPCPRRRNRTVALPGAAGARIAACRGRVRDPRRRRARR